MHNGQSDLPLRINLNELGFPQQSTPIKTYISSAGGVFTATFRKKIQGNGYDILLDKGPGKTKGLLFILVTEKTNYWGLLSKTSSMTSL